MALIRALSLAAFLLLPLAADAVTFTVAGRIYGYTGAGLVLQDNGGDNNSPSAGSAVAFTFATAINSGSTYSVTVSTNPTGPAQTCTVAQGSGTISANVTNVSVFCNSASTTWAPIALVFGYAAWGQVFMLGADVYPLQRCMMMAKRTDTGTYFVWQSTNGPDWPGSQSGVSTSLLTHIVQLSPNCF